MSNQLSLIKLQSTDNNELNRTKTPETKPHILNITSSSSNPFYPPQTQNAESSHFASEIAKGTNKIDGKRRRSKSPQLRAMDHLGKTQLKPKIIKAVKNHDLNKTVESPPKKEEDTNNLPSTSPVRRSSTLKDEKLVNNLGSIVSQIQAAGPGGGTGPGSPLKGLFKRKVNAISLVKRFTNVDIEDIPDEDLVELSINILQKTFLNRSIVDTKALTKLMSSVEFFKNYDDKTVQKCVRKMYHKELKKGETVFEIDTTGTTFWVVLKGSVSVWVHNTKTVTNEHGESIEQKFLVQLRVLPAGTAFGELSLMTDKPRRATIKCEENCHFAVLDKAPFSEILRDKEAKKLEMEIDFLLSIPIFKQWSYAAIKNLHNCGVVKYKRGHVLYSEGDPSHKMYVVKSGEFKVLKQIEIEDEDQVENDLKNFQTKLAKHRPVSKNVEIAILGDKELIGGEEFIFDIKRKYRVECTKEAEVLELTRKEFFNPTLPFHLSAKWLNQDILMKKKHYEERVAEIQKAQKNNGQFLVFKREGTSSKSRALSQEEIESLQERFTLSMALHTDNHSREQSPTLSTRIKTTETLSNRIRNTSNEPLVTGSDSAFPTQGKEPARETFYQLKSKKSILEQDKMKANPRNSKTSSNLFEMEDFSILKRKNEAKGGLHAKLMANSFVEISIENRKYNRDKNVSMTYYAAFSRRPSQPTEMSTSFVDYRKSRNVSLTPERGPEDSHKNSKEGNIQQEMTHSMPHSPGKFTSKNPYKKMIFNKLQKKFRKFAGDSIKIDLKVVNGIEKRTPFLFNSVMMTNAGTLESRYHTHEKTRTTSPTTPNQEKPGKSENRQDKYPEIRKGSLISQGRSSINENNQRDIRMNLSNLSNISVEDSLEKSAGSSYAKIPEKVRKHHNSFMLDKSSKDDENKNLGYDHSKIHKKRRSHVSML